jgi:hypothetical protein
MAKHHKTDLLLFKISPLASVDVKYQLFNQSINQSINQTSWYYLYVMALYGKFIRLLTVSHHLQISILLSGHHRTENIVVNSKFKFKQFL